MPTKPITPPELNIGEKIVDDQPDIFESMVLNALFNNQEFYDKVNGTLCFSALKQEWQDEFAHPLDNALYYMLQQYNLMMLDAKAIPRISEKFARVLLTQMANEAKLLALDEMDETLGRFLSVLELDDIESLMIARLGFSRWLSKKRASRVISETTARDSWTAEETMAAVSAEVDAVQIASQGDNIFAFGHGIRNCQLDIERVPLGIAKLDKALGGGVGRKEGVLFVAGQGAGKTIAATQFAASLATQGMITLLITTEQPHDQLEVRLASNLCSIPFDRIKDKFDRDKLAGPERERWDALEAQLSKNLHIADWLDDNAISVAEDLEREVKKAIKKFGRLDAIVLDWIGGALGKSAADPERIRHIYQTAGDSFCATMNRHNLIGLAFAQGHSTLAANKARVDASCLAECKSLGRKFTNGIGISALSENMDELVAAGGANMVWKPTQFFYVFKGRKGEGGLAPFRRDYAFQRMGQTY